MRLEVSPRALEHAETLNAWWNENRPAARVRVEEAFTTALDGMVAFPESGALYPPRPAIRPGR